MYNLHVGNSVNDWFISPLENPTGMQDLNARGHHFANGEFQFPFIGTTPFSNDEQKGINYSDYNGSIVELYVNNYKNLLESNFGVEIDEARLIYLEELTRTEIGCGADEYGEGTCNSAKFSWIYSTSYWTGSAISPEYIWHVLSNSEFGNSDYLYDSCLGVRPVIIISKDYFE
jgi:hypothetical protein